MESPASMLTMGGGPADRSQDDPCDMRCVGESGRGRRKRGAAGMHNVLVVATGGAVGAVARYGLSAWAAKRWGASFPAVGTLLVNVLGCFVLGALLAVVAQRPEFSPRVRLAIGTGLLGSFTTFSTFGFETFELAREGLWSTALWNVGLNLILGLGAVYVGQALARHWVS